MQKENFVDRILNIFNMTILAKLDFRFNMIQIIISAGFYKIYKLVLKILLI